MGKKGAQKLHEMARVVAAVVGRDHEDQKKQKDPNFSLLSSLWATHLARHAGDERDLALVARLIVGHGRKVLGGGLAHSHGC